MAWEIVNLQYFLYFCRYCFVFSTATVCMYRVQYATCWFSSFSKRIISLIQTCKLIERILNRIDSWFGLRRWCLFDLSLQTARSRSSGNWCNASCQKYVNTSVKPDELNLRIYIFHTPDMAWMHHRSCALSAVFLSVVFYDPKFENVSSFTKAFDIDRMSWQHWLSVSFIHYHTKRFLLFADIVSLNQVYFQWHIYMVTTATNYMPVLSDICWRSMLLRAN